MIIMPDAPAQQFQQVIEGEGFEVSRLEVSQPEEP
jgi:hypothetical protein